MRPWFSVVIPTHNRCALARRAIACALEQQDVEVEVIVVDDRSTDGSRDELAKVDDPRVRLLDGPGLGPCAARNLALPHVRAPWVAFLDDDDLWAPTKLRELSRRTEDGDFGFTSAVVIDQHGVPMRIDGAPGTEDLARQLRARNAIGTPSGVVARTDVVRELGGFDERLPVLGDWDLWLRMAANRRAFALPEPLTAYTVHWGSISVTRAGAVEDELRLLMEKHADVRVDMNWFTQWNAENLLRCGRRREAITAFFADAIRSRSLQSLLRGGRMLLGERLVGRLRPPARPPLRPAWLDTFYPLAETDPR
jgi:glycosyltransferase involved in cell wall biosynthesis